ncbi:MAG: phosphatidylglycerophosphatase A [Pseudomonadota bacterium]|nr:phosphatidylglycerophosphatase A [Pseudomonadota bacterium]
MSARAPSLRLLANPVHLLSFGGGLGLAPVAPGTFGTLLGFPLAWALRALAAAAGAAAMWGLLALLFALATWCADRTARMLGSGDPGSIVCDEYLAFAALLLLVPAEPWTQAWAFLCFRLFDVTKPPPVGWADAHLHGGFGIMADDVLAAIWAAGLLYLLARLGMPGGPLV